MSPQRQINDLYNQIIDNAKSMLTEKFIKELHLILKSGTSDSRLEWFAVGDYAAEWRYSDLNPRF